jgi:hypothetical protein
LFRRVFQSFAKAVYSFIQALVEINVCVLAATLYSRTAARRSQGIRCIHWYSACDVQMIGHSEVVEEQVVCSGRLKRNRDTFLPLLEHAIASSGAV